MNATAPVSFPHLANRKPMNVTVLLAMIAWMDTAIAAMGEYTDLGGRVFMSHWHNYWITEGPAAWRETGTSTSAPT